MIITHNISAINTRRNLTISNRNLSKSLEKLSSGYRINVGADGPADLIISEQLRAQNAGLERAVRNTQEASNVLGIAEGALNEMNAILKKMRALALHAANNGITSPEQVAADQSEVDSGIQTIDRIANTTKYSDQFLLNGGKGIVFDRNTIIKGTQQNSLLDTGSSRIDQIFKREGFAANITFTGTSNPNSTTGVGVADVSKEARKAYFEIDSANGNNDVSATGALTRSQDFILTGTKGSRHFHFDSGTSLGQISNAISNVADSTGVEASLIFGSTQAFADSTDDNASVDAHLGGGGAMRNVNNIAIFNQGSTGERITYINNGITGVQAGKNTDGNGRIYIKYTGNRAFELYKDASLSKASLVAHGSHGSTIVADNNSGLGGLRVNVSAGAPSSVNSNSYLGILGLNLNDAGVDVSGAFGAGASQITAANSTIYGVELGKNTDSEGDIYLKIISTGGAGKIFVYRDSAMRDEDLVAKSGTVSLANTSTQIVNEVRSADNTSGTGLGLALGVTTAFAAGTFTAKIHFNNLGVRISSSDYGADAYVRIEQNAGKVWQYYEQADSNSSTMLDAGTAGITVQQNGQDATLSVNGRKVVTNGLELNLSTQDIQARLQFDPGQVGSTTMAQVGYTEGTLFANAGRLTNTNLTNGLSSVNGGGYLTNAGHVTLEQLDHFKNGMQFQLGEGAGDQERTIYSIDSMDVANLGVTSFTGQFDPAKAVVETRQLSLQDVLGGGLASLAVDPVKALSIIDRAISDVSNLRARLGATQANLLQTNANSLQVAIENIQKTESVIRDTDMASETTQFTRNQIMVSAGTSMLAQANVVFQSVLQLLG